MKWRADDKQSTAVWQPGPNNVLQLDSRRHWASTDATQVTDDDHFVSWRLLPTWRRDLYMVKLVLLDCGSS